MKRYLVAAAALALAVCLGPTIEPNAYGQKGQTKKDNLIPTFFDVPAAGKDFCIICDRSGSMHAGKAWWDYNLKKTFYGKKSSFEFLQEELTKTIKDIQDKGRFYVIFYDTDITDMPGKKNRWRRTAKDAEDAIKWIKKLTPKGKTKPAKAFDIAFNLKPRPDVIFFMSDGIIPDAQKFYEHVMRQHKTAGKGKTKIVTIQLNVPGTDPASVMLSSYVGKTLLPGTANLIERLKIAYGTPTQRAKRRQDNQLQLQLMQAIAAETKGQFKLVTTIKKNKKTK